MEFISVFPTCVYVMLCGQIFVILVTLKWMIDIVFITVQDNDYAKSVSINIVTVI